MKSLRLVNFVKPVETADLAPSQNLTIVHDPKFNDTKGSNDYWYPGKPVIIFSNVFLHSIPCAQWNIWASRTSDGVLNLGRNSLLST